MLFLAVSLSKATLAGETFSSDDLQSLFMRGEGLVAQGKTEAGLGLWRQAGSNGLLRAQATLAETLLAGTNSLSRKEGLDWALLAGRQADPTMQRRLVSELRAGDAVALFRESRPWLDRLASQGEPQMTFRAGLWSFFGYSGHRDFDSAFSWFSIANQDDAFRRQAPQSPYFLGYLVENGYASNQDYSAAAKLYWEAAELGWPQAVYRLALLIEHGQGIVQSGRIANLLYTKASEIGVAEAAYRLGLLAKAKGTGSESRKEAFAWFLRAATNGISMGLTKVGLGYEQGWASGEIDLVEALAWYQLAAIRGNRGARIKAENLERKLSEQQRLEPVINFS